MSDGTHCTPCWVKVVSHMNRAIESNLELNDNILDGFADRVAKEQFTIVSGKTGKTLTGQRTGYCDQHFQAINTSNQATADDLDRDWSMNFQGTELRDTTREAVRRADQRSWLRVVSVAQGSNEKSLAQDLWLKNKALARTTWAHASLQAQAVRPRLIGEGYGPVLDSVRIRYTQPSEAGMAEEEEVKLKYTELALREMEALSATEGVWDVEKISALAPRDWMDQQELSEECCAVHTFNAALKRNRE